LKNNEVKVIFYQKLQLKTILKEKEVREKE